MRRNHLPKLVRQLCPTSRLGLVHQLCPTSWTRPPCRSRLTRKSLLVSLLLLGFVSVGSCSTENATALNQVLGKSSQPPEILDCRAVSGDTLEFLFSLPVRVKSLQFEPTVKIDSIETDGATVRVSFSEGPGPGDLLTADLLVEDKNGNTVNVLASLRTKNDRIPKMLINELRTEYSKPKPEFIEFKMLEAGNLGALRVFIAATSRLSMVYEFAPVEVAADELVVLHLRTIEDASIDERSDDLDESKAADSSPTARDFWVPGTTKLINKTGAVYVLDQDDQVLDAVMISENVDAWWGKSHFVTAAEFLFDKGAWKSADGKTPAPKDAVITGTTTATRTICRDETVDDTDAAADWYITATSSATPGKPNNPKRHQ